MDYKISHTIRVDSIDKGVYEMWTKRYTEEFKIEAIKLVLDGKTSQNQVAEDIGIAGTTLSTWVRKYKADPSRGIQNALHPTDAERELRLLKKQNRELQEENEILKKAAAFFAKNQK